MLYTELQFKDLIPTVTQRSEEPLHIPLDTRPQFVLDKQNDTVIPDIPKSCARQNAEKGGFGDELCELHDGSEPEKQARIA
jgi:hypothetical protein